MHTCPPPALSSGLGLGVEVSTEEVSYDGVWVYLNISHH